MVGLRSVVAAAALVAQQPALPVDLQLVRRENVGRLRDPSHLEHLERHHPALRRSRQSRDRFGVDAAELGEQLTGLLGDLPELARLRRRHGLTLRLGLRLCLGLRLLLLLLLGDGTVGVLLGLAPARGDCAERSRRRSCGCCRGGRLRGLDRIIGRPAARAILSAAPSAVFAGATHTTTSSACAASSRASSSSSTSSYSDSESCPDSHALSASTSRRRTLDSSATSCSA